MFKKRGLLQFILDRLCFPLLVFLSYKASEKIGLTPIDAERTYACLKHARGMVLDIGCGDGRFICDYGNGYGIDRVVAGNPRLILAEAARIPFKDKTFDTVTFIACLNHVVDREASLREAARVLKDDGRVLITMIGPFIGFLAHKVIRKRHDPDQIKRRMADGELLGLTDERVRAMTSHAGLKIVARKSILLFCNKLYICEKTPDK